MTSGRGSAQRALRGALWGLAALHGAEALLLRRRREALAALPTADPHPEGGDADADAAVDVRSVAGTGLDDRTRAAVRREMDRCAVGVIDLVPGDLPPDRWLRLLRRLDVERLGRDPLVHPGGAHEAVALDRSVAGRMGLAGDAVVDRGALARLTTRAQRYSPAAHTLRLAPGVTAGPLTGEERWRELAGVTAYAWPYASWPGLITALETAHLLAMTAGALVAPVPALAALVTWAAQPALVLRPVPDQPALPAGERGRAALLRLPRAIAANARTVAAGHGITRARSAARAATSLPPALTPGEQFEPRRDTCPWCGSGALVAKHEVPDLLLHKPGTYHLDECGDCGHVFQNPRLTAAGLAYVYEDSYDGTGAELAEVAFAFIRDVYRSRLATVERVGRPRAVLDVGSAHAHFLLTARRAWPGTVCDALDMSENVEEARRRGWVDTAHVGQFQELAGSLPRSYDLVVMTHYLEHVPDPRGELAAATKVLEPGGHLLVEVPDPEYRLGRVLGRYWVQWGQPEHLQLMPCRNLSAAIEQAGFEIVSVERVTVRGDLLNSLGLFLQHRSRSPHLPWLPDPGRAHRLKRLALYTAALPVITAAKVADVVKERPFTQYGHFRPDRSNQSYRILARRI